MIYCHDDFEELSWILKKLLNEYILDISYSISNDSI